MTSTTLYLVSAEKDGTDYWKVGITHHADPLKRDRKHYKEVFRAIEFPDYQFTEVWGANRCQCLTAADFDEMAQDPDWFANNATTTTENDAPVVEAFIKESFQQIGCSFGDEAIPASAPLEDVLALFDLHVLTWSRSPSLLADTWEDENGLGQIDFEAALILIDAMAAKVKAGIEDAKALQSAYRPNPAFMWS